MLDHKVPSILLIIFSFTVLVVSVEIVFGQSHETYENSLSGFKFQYPSEWTLRMLEGNNTVSFDLNPESSANRTDVLVERTFQFIVLSTITLDNIYLNKQR